MGDIQNYARRLMRVREQATQATNRSTARAIFGSIGELQGSVSSRAIYRIGLWSCLSPKPTWAMGMWAALAHLLERSQDVQVYRLFARFEDEQTDFNWSIEQSQFKMEDWAVEPLDENIAIWGELKPNNAIWDLNIFIENDLFTGEDNEAQKLQFSIANSSDFIEQVPKIAASILETIGAGRIDESDPVYLPSSIEDESALDSFLNSVVVWEGRLQAFLWDIEWDDEQITQDYENLVAKAVSTPADFVYWLLAKSIAQTMLPGYSVIGELLTGEVDSLVEKFSASMALAPILAQAIYGMGLSQEAYQVLEQTTDAQPEHTAAWVKLAELYLVSGRLQNAISTCQNAIEAKSVSAYLYFLYGTCLVLAQKYQQSLLETFVLLEDVKVNENPLAWEAVSAYNKSLELKLNDVRTLYNLVLLLISLNDEQGGELWEKFAWLVNSDDTGEYVRDTIEAMYELEDISKGIETLQAVLQRLGKRFDLLINLAALHLVFDEADEALPYLEQAQTLATTISMKAEVERLLLVANDYEFEAHFADLAAIVEAGNSLSAEDMEFLEEAAAEAPHWLEAQILLARAYSVWDDDDAALEVLLDTHEHFPNDPILIDLLAEVLWNLEQEELAFQYLNQGLAAHPFDVPLLVRTGRYLFDNLQLDEARAFLVRAEEIEPRDKTLQSTRAYIANKMAQNPELYRQSKD